MAFFPDLTPYTYFAGESPPALNVGWLDPSAPHAVGDTSEEFRRKLELLCQRPVQQTRGFHRCAFCPQREWPDHPAGSAEIRVAGADGLVYAAPTLIHHYVVAHEYKPPDEFIAAVLGWQEPEAKL